MNKLLKFFIVMLLFVSMIPAKTTKALVKGNYEYILVEDGVAITRFLNSEKEIPEYIDGKPVVQIGQESSGSRYLRPTGYTGKIIKLPSTIRVVEDGAFFGDVQLEEIDLNYGLEHIGYMAFSTSARTLGDFSDLDNLVIPTTVKYIGINAFQYSTILNLVISQGVEDIGDYAFANTQIYNLVQPINASLRMYKND